MTNIGNIVYTQKLDHGLKAPYDGVDIKSDRKSGWNVRHPDMGWRDGKIGTWIEAVPDRELAGRIHEALCIVADNAVRVTYAQVPE